MAGWFASEIIGILPIARKRENPDDDPLAGCDAALARGDILIFFPEGSRGEPEHMATYKRGIGLLAQRHPDVPVYPILTHGFGKALPKNEALLVPFILDIFIGQPLHGNDGHDDFVATLRERTLALAPQRHEDWD